MVSNIAVGYDNIDVAAAKARGIVVTNTPDVLTEATAEFTWGLIFGGRVGSPKGTGWCAGARWKGWALDFMLGTELRGKQLGIIGRGRIGRAVARQAPAFGMTRRVREATDSVARRAAGQLRCRVASTCRSTPETRHLIDRAGARADEAVGDPGQHRAGADCRRGGARVGAEGAADRRRGAGRLRTRAGVHPALLRSRTSCSRRISGSATRETRTAMADLAVTQRPRGARRHGPPSTPVYESFRLSRPFARGRVRAVMRRLARAIEGLEEPAVEKIAEEQQDDPFQVLIATMLSAQTRTR